MHFAVAELAFMKNFIFHAIMPKAARIRMFKMSTKIEILNSIENIKQEIISFLQEFIQAASPNPPGDTTLAAKVISKLLKKRNAISMGCAAKNNAQYYRIN